MKLKHLLVESVCQTGSKGDIGPTGPKGRISYGQSYFSLTALHV